MEKKKKKLECQNRKNVSRGGAENAEEKKCLTQRRKDAKMRRCKAPKERNVIAQGNALGCVEKMI